MPPIRNSSTTGTFVLTAPQKWPGEESRLPWGSGSAPLELEAGSSVSFREAMLVMRTGNRGFPMAYIHAELQTKGGRWTPREIYIVPQWEALL